MLDPKVRCTLTLAMPKSTQPVDQLRVHRAGGDEHRSRQGEINAVTRTRLELTCLGCLVRARRDTPGQVGHPGHPKNDGFADVTYMPGRVMLSSL